MIQKSAFARLLVALIIILTTFVSPQDVASQTPIARVFVNPASSTAKTCQPHTIAISVEDVVDLTAFELKIDFDPTVVEVTGVENAGWLVAPGEEAFFSPANNDDSWNEDGYILFGMAQQGDGTGDPVPKSGDGDLILITLQALVPNDSVTFEIDDSNSLLVDWPDAFEIEFTSTDGTVTTDNCVPTAYPQTLNTYINTPLAITLTGFDPDGDPLEYLIQTNPSNGVLSGDPPNLTYTPNTDFVGTDSFTFLVSDGLDNSTAATITINVKDVPVAQPDYYDLPVNGSLTVTAPGVLGNDTAPNSEPLHAVLVDDVPASEGTLAFESDGSFVFTPASGFVGTTTFTYRACYNGICSAPATVTIQVLETTCLQVDPESLEQSLYPNETADQTLTVINTCDYEVPFELLETTAPLTAPLLLDEGFEGGSSFPADWLRSSRGATLNTWTIKDALVDNPDHIDEGQYAAWITYDVANASDEWLLTPSMDVSAATDMTLSFRAWSSTLYPGATMKVWVTDAAGDPLTDEPLWNLIRDEDWADPGYRSVFVDLSAFDGYDAGEIRIAWQYVGQNGQSFGLDEVEVGGRSEVTWLSQTPTGATLLASGTTDITVTFDSTGLVEGNYFAAIFVQSEPYPTVQVPVILHVLGEGFEYYIPLFRR